jgi:electron transport complex protein RnfG
LDDFNDLFVPNPDPDNEIENSFTAWKDGKIIGIVMELSRFGYSGPIRIITGVDPDGVLQRVKIMEISDTPGLGANAASPSYFVAEGMTFYDQFANKMYSDPFDVNKDVITITASTITSKAVAKMAKAAGECGIHWLYSKGGVNE